MSNKHKGSDPMLRHAALSGLLVALLAAALPAQAQMATYCGGALEVAAFSRQIPPGSGWAIFDGRIRNVSSRPQTFQMTVLAPLQPTTTVPTTLAPRNSRMIDFSQRTQSGVEPLTPEQAARYVRITCQ
jgi:hypothetical protein